MVELTYKRRTFEIILDFLLIGFAYYLAFWTSYWFVYERSEPGTFSSDPADCPGRHLSVVFRIRSLPWGLALCRCG